MLTRLAAIPRVEQVGSISHLPVTGSHNTWGGRVISAGHDGTDPENVQMDQRIVDGAYFTVVGVPLLSGRAFGPEDVADAPRTVLLNRAASRVLFGDDTPVGKRLHVGSREATVIGVVGDVAQTARAAAAPTIYHDYDQLGAFQAWPMRQVLRFGRETTPDWPAIREALALIDPSLAMDEPLDLSDLVASGMARERFASFVLRLLAGLATLLASLGLYSALARSVAGRQHEIGVRLAVGADGATVRGMVLREGAGLAALGVTVGLGAALALAGTLRSLIYGISPRDPLVFGTVAGLVLLIALLASWLPARQATAVDPRKLLRS